MVVHPNYYEARLHLSLFSKQLARWIYVPTTRKRTYEVTYDAINTQMDAADEDCGRMEDRRRRFYRLR